MLFRCSGRPEPRNVFRSDIVRGMCCERHLALISAVTGSNIPVLTRSYQSYCETNAPSTQPTFTYSYFTAAEDQMSGGTAPICRCYTAHPAYPAIANSAAGSTVCDNNQAYSVLRIQTAFTYNGCYQGTPSGASASAGDDGDCFAICGTSTMVAAYFDAMDSKTGTCYCDATPPSDRVPSSCGETNGFFYSRTAAAVASGVYRRNQRMAQRAAQAQAAENKYCPAKYLPCKILGTGSYEVSLDDYSHMGHKLTT